MANQIKDGIIPVGVIGAARGLKGDMRVKSYTQNPKSIGSIGTLTDETGTRTFDLKVIGFQKSMVLVRIKGVEDRSAVDTLKGQTLYTARDSLPQTQEDEFYFSDLQGLDVELVDGEPFGHVVEVEDFGGGPFLDVQSLNHGQVLIPFTKASVPVVDIKGRRIVIDPPDGLLQAGDPEPQGDG